MVEVTDENADDRTNASLDGKSDVATPNRSSRKKKKIIRAIIGVIWQYQYQVKYRA